MLKRGYTAQLSFEMPDSDKMQAEQAISYFEELVSNLKLARNHLNLIYQPFSRYEKLDPEVLLDQRIVLRRYRDMIKENYDYVLQLAYKAATSMGSFNTDKSINEMMNSFVSELDGVEDKVNILLSIFSNIGAENFRDLILAKIDEIKEESVELEDMVAERILPHIDENILAKNWTNYLPEGTIPEKPLVSRLYKERRNNE